MTTTLKALKDYFAGKDISEVGELESKQELKDTVTDFFKRDLENGISPVLSFQLLYHRLTEIANVAKEVFYQPAIEDIKKDLDESNTTFLYGAKVTLRSSDEYEFVKSPRIMKLERERQDIEAKNSKVIKAYDKYKSDVKSINNQIKAEQERLIEQGLATKKGTKESISLSY